MGATVEQNIKVKIDAIVKGLAEVKKLQKELQDVEKLAGKKLSINTSAAESGANRLVGLLRNISSSSDGTLSRIESLGSSAGLSLGKLAGPAGLAAASIAAIGGAALAAAKLLFDLTKQASDAGSEIYDLQQKTNLSAETLSVLKVQAEQSGSNLETAANSVAKFNKNLVEAADGNKELSTALKLFGLDAKKALVDPEAALKQFIQRFNELPDSARKNAAAQKLFNDKTGELLPVLKSFGTDVDGLTERLRKLGLVWTQDGIEAADAFGDALTELEQTIEGVKKEIAIGAMPAIQAAIGGASSSLQENRERWREWGASVGTAITTAKLALDAFGLYLKSPLSPFFGVYWITVGIRYLNLRPGQAIQSLLEGAGPSVAGQGGSSAALGAAVDAVTGAVSASAPKIDGSPKGPGGGGSKQKKETADDRGLRLLQQLQEENKRLGETRKTNLVLIELEKKEYIGLSETIRQNILLEAGLIEAKNRKAEKAKKDIETTSLIKEFIAGQNETLRQLIEGEKTATDRLEDFIQKLREREAVFEPWLEDLLRIKALLIDSKNITDNLDLSKLQLDPDLGKAQGPADPSLHLFDDTPPEDREEERDFLSDLKAAASDSGINHFIDALNDMATGAKDAKEAFRDMALSIIQDIEAMIIKFLVLAAVKAIAGVLSGGSSSSGTALEGLGGGVSALAEGDFVSAKPGGRIVQVAEAGYDEVVLTTDPKHRGRTEGLLAEFLSRTGILPQFAQGGFIRSVLGSITPSVPRLAAGGFVAAPSIEQLAGGFSIGKQTNQIVLPNVKDVSGFRNSRQTLEREAGRMMAKGARRLRGGG